MNKDFMNVVQSAKESNKIVVCVVNPFKLPDAELASLESIADVEEAQRKVLGYGNTEYLYFTDVTGEPAFLFNYTGDYWLDAGNQIVESGDDEDEYKTEEFKDLYEELNENYGDEVCNDIIDEFLQNYDKGMIVVFDVSTFDDSELMKKNIKLFASKYNAIIYKEELYK